MKIYDINGKVFMEAETELEAAVLRNNCKQLERYFDKLVSESIKKAQRQ